jgi:hypothetical protein
VRLSWSVFKWHTISVSEGDEARQSGHPSEVAADVGAPASQYRGRTKLGGPLQGFAVLGLLFLTAASPSIAAAAAGANPQRGTGQTSSQGPTSTIALADHSQIRVQEGERSQICITIPLRDLDPALRGMLEDTEAIKDAHLLSGTPAALVSMKVTGTAARKKLVIDAQNLDRNDAAAQSFLVIFRPEGGSVRSLQIDVPQASGQ